MRGKEHAAITQRGFGQGIASQFFLELFDGQSLFGCRFASFPPEFGQSFVECRIFNARICRTSKAVISAVGIFPSSSPLMRA